ncbi:MAG TPA: nucleotide disphospho-sugar-binding domain-containing protein, partial [Trueperaceae bacterium]|nr:nucleotide disphospho-sugar-binding domain-containing protein [Trueperaceae bacterium]
MKIWFSMIPGHGHFYPLLPLARALAGAGHWVNMPKLLERTSVLMHHGGWGSTIAALASGTPSVVVPLGSDQHVNA